MNEINKPLSQSKKKLSLAKKAFSNKAKDIRLFFSEEILDMIVINNFFLCDIGSGFR
jgi:hypothetical protein